MANKERIDCLLLDIKELETLIAGMRDAEVYSAPFFSDTFQLTHKIVKELHTLEEGQIEALRKQMEEHQRLIGSIPTPLAPSVPDTTPSAISLQPESKKEEILSQDITIEQSIAREEPIWKQEIPYNTLLSDKQGISLNEVLEKKNLSDFRKAFSLNDRFRFRRDLFGGNEEKMNLAIADLNDIHSYEDSITYLDNMLKWNVEDTSVADFIKLLEKRFL